MEFYSFRFGEMKVAQADAASPKTMAVEMKLGFKNPERHTVEAIALGRAAGLDLDKMRDVLLGGAASSWMLQNHAPLIMAKNDAAGFRIDLQLKDLRLAGELAFELGVPLPGTALVTSLYLALRAHGEGSLGNQALFRVYDRLAAQAAE